jgi:hypothetical protein
VSHARKYVIVEDLARVIFKDIDLFWLHLMWDECEDDRDELIKVLYLLYLTRL